MGLLGIRVRRERRRFVRVPFAGTVRVAVIPPPFRNGIWHLTAENLSEGGLRLACGESCSVECGVLLDLDAPGSATPIRVVGKVVWVEQLPNEQESHVGVRFTELGAIAHAQLRTLTPGHLAEERTWHSVWLYR